MWGWLKARTKSGGSPASQGASPPAAPKADLSTRVDGDHNNVVNIVVQGGSLVPLPMRTTVWTETPQDLDSVAALLRWNTRLAPLLGRDIELAQLRAWAESDHPISIQLLHAPGGQGKTRLAAEFAMGLQNWSHGWLDLADFSPANALTWQGRCLLLVDYPEHQPIHLERMAQAVERSATSLPGQRLRILLVAREAQSIQTALQQRPCAAWLKPPLLLSDLPDISGHQLVQAALDRLSALLGKAPVSVASNDVAQWRALHPLNQSPLLATALAIQLARQPVLCALPERWLIGAELLGWLVEHETRWWEKTAAGHGAPAGALTTIMAWATLSGSLTDQHVNQTLAVDQGWSPSDLGAIHAALKAACRRVGKYRWAPMEPDLLAACFIDEWLANPARQGREAADAALAQALLNTDNPSVFPFHLNRLHMLAYDQTVRLGLRPPQDAHRLERVVTEWAAAQEPLMTCLGECLIQRSSWPGLAWLAATVAKQRVEDLTADAPEAERALRLSHLAVFMRATGDLASALTPAQEAVVIHRRLAQANPGVYETELANSLNNLAGFLAETGKQEGALVLAREAVKIHLGLAQTNSAAHEPDLAMCLSNLALHLTNVGDHEGALVQAKAAVTIRRRLAQAHPETYEPGLAESLNSQATLMNKTGDCAGGLASVQEAVEIRRRLAKANPATHECALAASLSNLALFSSKATNDQAGALAPAQEAASIFRRLAQANPAAYEPYLAASLTNLAICLRSANERAGAVEPAREAVSIRRRLASTNAEEYESGLAESLHTLANCLSEIGDLPGALKSGKEAVAIRSRLAQMNPAACEPLLAASLTSLAIFQVAVGEDVAAQASALEAVEIRRRLARSNSTACERDLAGSLNVFANCLSRTGDMSGAVAAAQEAVDIYRRLSTVSPAAFRPFLAAILNNLANKLAGIGDREGAVSAAQEAVDNYRSLSQANPAVFTPLLAASLSTLAQCQTTAGNKREAHATAEDALRVFTYLAMIGPQIFENHRERTKKFLDGMLRSD